MFFLCGEQSVISQLQSENICFVFNYIINHLTLHTGDDVMSVTVLSNENMLISNESTLINTRLAFITAYVAM